MDRSPRSAGPAVSSVASSVGLAKDWTPEHFINDPYVENFLRGMFSSFLHKPDWLVQAQNQQNELML